MPIRINLLAEQQAAEEMRRRDPVKRAIFAGAGLVGLMLLWIGLSYSRVKVAESELALYSEQLRSVEDESKDVRQNQSEIHDIQSRIAALDKYSTNRFFWGTFLDSLQHIAVQDLRLTEVRGTHSYQTNAGTKLLSTNILAATPPKPPFWKFWANANAVVVEDKSVATLTNKGIFLTNVLEYKVKTSVVSRNAKGVTTKYEFVTLPWAMEQITVEIKGRDYGKRPGSGIDEFSRKLSDHEFYKEWLSSSEGFRFTERPPQPRPDPTDPVNPGAMFVPFTIECRIKDRVFTHE